MKIGLISCVKTKQTKAAKAREMYISDLFKKSLSYCLKNYDKVYILSAKYGLLELDETIAPYELTLNKMTKHQKKVWSYNVLQKLQEVTNIKTDHFYIHAGENYREYLVQKLNNYTIPLKGLSFGNQLKYYNEHN